MKRIISSLLLPIVLVAGASFCSPIKSMDDQIHPLKQHWGKALCGAAFLALPAYGAYKAGTAGAAIGLVAAGAASYLGWQAYRYFLEYSINRDYKKLVENSGLLLAKDQRFAGVKVTPSAAAKGSVVDLDQPCKAMLGRWAWNLQDKWANDNSQWFTLKTVRDRLQSHQDALEKQFSAQELPEMFKTLEINKVVINDSHIWNWIENPAISYDLIKTAINTKYVFNQSVRLLYCKIRIALLWVDYLAKCPGAQAGVITV